jgi:hypothetical protein
MILTFVEVRPVSKLKQSLIRQRRENPTMISDIWHQIQPVFMDHLNSHLTGSTTFGCSRTTNDPHVINPGDFVEYCREQIPNQDGQSYFTKTTAKLYQSNGTIIPLHQAESSIEIETSNHLH